MSVDNCKEGLSNTGGKVCDIADVLGYIYLDMAKDSNGDPKERNNTDLTEIANLTPLLNAADPLDRIYPLGKFEQVNHNREDDVFWTAQSGAVAHIRPGFKLFTGAIVDAPRELADKLNANRTQGFGFHFIDVTNKLVTKKGSTTAKCKPILVNNQSFFAKYVEKSDADNAPAMVMVSFQWKASELDGDVKVVSPIDYSPEDIEGLQDADAVFTLPTINGFTANIFTTCFNTPVTGLLIGDFTLAEVSPTPGDITGNIASVTENPLVPGEYAFLFTAPETLGDVLRLTATEDGYDFSAMSDGSNDITIV